MAISLLAGVLVSEGMYQYHKSDYCPEFITKKSELFVESSNHIHCLRIACAVIFVVIASRFALSHATLALRGRLLPLRIPLKFASKGVGNYPCSIPFFVGAVCYFCRRDVLYGLGLLLFSFYRGVEEITAVLADVVLNPRESMERLREELEQEIRGLNAALRVVAGGAPAEAVQVMDGHLARYEAQYAQRQQIIQQYQEKLNVALGQSARIKSELSERRERLTNEKERLVQLFSELEIGGLGYFENCLKWFYDVENLLKQAEENLRQTDELIKLSDKVAMLATGIATLEVIEKQEYMSLKQWNIMVLQAPLRRVEGIVLFLADLPFLTKKVINTRCYGGEERCDDLYTWSRKKEVACELAPKGVELLSKQISVLNRARERVIRALNDEDLEARDMWKTEHLLLEKANILLKESTLEFWKRLFPQKHVSSAIADTQRSIESSRQRYTQSIASLPEEHQKLLRLEE